MGKRKFDEYKDWFNRQIIKTSQEGRITAFNGRNIANDGDLVKVLFDALREEFEGHWISVSKRIPSESDGEVFNFYTFGKCLYVSVKIPKYFKRARQMLFCLDDKKFISDVDSGDVVEWQPLEVKGKRKSEHI